MICTHKPFIWTPTHNYVPTHSCTHPYTHTLMYPPTHVRIHTHHFILYYTHPLMYTPTHIIIYCTTYCFALVTEIHLQNSSNLIGQMPENVLLFYLADFPGCFVL